MIGILIAFAVFLRGTDLGKVQALRPVIDFLYYGWYIYPLLDRLGVELYNGSWAVYRGFEHGVVDVGLNVKLPSALINGGTKFFKDVQTGLLRDYVGLYVVGLILLMVIALVIIGVI